MGGRGTTALGLALGLRRHGGRRVHGLVETEIIPDEGGNPTHSVWSSEAIIRLVETEINPEINSEIIPIVRRSPVFTLEEPVGRVPILRVPVHLGRAHLVRVRVGVSVPY